jgi:tRNA (guanine-N7-)-methyltransferase
MRHRKIKDIKERIKEFDALLYSGQEHRGALLSSDGFSSASDGNGAGETAGGLYVELGCGRGTFLSEVAQLYPRRHFIGVEGNTSIIYRAMQKTSGRGLTNVSFIPEYVNDIEEHFGRESIAGLYLNFSDPWPKDRHEKRRLTYAPRTEAYHRVLTQGGFAALKTDNEPFFDFSLQSFKAAGFEITAMVRDLYAASGSEPRTLPPEAKLPTEYETKFKAQGKKINYALAKKT